MDQRRLTGGQWSRGARLCRYHDVAVCAAVETADTVGVLGRRIGRGTIWTLESRSASRSRWRP